MNEPPPLTSAKKSGYSWLIVVVAVALFLLGALGYGLYRVVHTITTSGVTSKLDQQFGDQPIKTAVALIELHKVRTGRYPENLQQLRFTGQWDILALQSVRYIAAADGKSYFVEVQRGWIGKPAMELPPDFWN